MHVCMYVYMYMHIHIYTYTHKYIYIWKRFDSQMICSVGTLTKDDSTLSHKWLVLRIVPYIVFAIIIIKEWGYHKIYPYNAILLTRLEGRRHHLIWSVHSQMTSHSSPSQVRYGLSILSSEKIDHAVIVPHDIVMAMTDWLEFWNAKCNNWITRLKITWDVYNH